MHEPVFTNEKTEDKVLGFLLVEISGIEALTFPAVNAGKPPKADLIEMQEVSGVPTHPNQRKNSHLSVTVFLWWR